MTTNQYHHNRAQKFSGQLAWATELSDPDRVADLYWLVAGRGFQAAWKATVGIPSHGNHNPNWKDGLVYLQAVHDYYPAGMGQQVHDMPFMKDIPFDFMLDTYEQWECILKAARLYERLLHRKISQPKQSGSLAYVFERGFIYDDYTLDEMANVCEYRLFRLAKGPA